MARKTTEGGGAAPTGIIGALRSSVGTGIALLKTRFELIGAELEEQREWLERMMVLSVIALFCLSFGVVFLTLFITMLFWDDYGEYVLGGFAALYLGAGIWAFLALKKKIRNKPKMFAATVAELGKDHEHLVEKMARENT